VEIDLQSTIRIILALALVLLSNAALADVERVDNFALLDHKGSFHKLSSYGDSKAVVIISTDTACPEVLDHLHKYQLLRSTWESRDISFLALNANPQDSLEDVRRMDAAYHLDMPVLMDHSQLIAENLGISRAGEIIVLEPNRLQVIYRGGLDIDAQRPRPSLGIAGRQATHALADSLQAAAAGERDAFDDTVVTAATGCPLKFAGRDRHLSKTPDYATQVAPILKEKCATCHVEGGIAPFAMDSHQMVQGWSPMIREVLLTRRMPPAQVDPALRHFSNARYIGAEEMQTLVHWIDAGSPRGNGEYDPLESVSAPDSRWQLGEPDYIVRVPAFTVPATGVLDYENVTINLPFEEDVWIKSVQHLPGDRRVLHHLLSFIVPADYSEKIVEGENDQYREFLEGYAPGKDEAATYPENTGVFVPKGSAVQMSLHYTTFGREVVDETLLGLYFADEPPQYQYSTYALSHGGDSLKIPPGVAEHRMRASHVFNEAIVLHGLRPHMHFRGKYMRFSVVYPDGSHEAILNVPDYNFNWQPTYRMSEPMELPAGSRVIIEGAFDNSQYNLGNPDPGAVVRGGAQSWDEMFIGYFSYHRQAAQ
jgi:peroxiredoxin